MTGRFHITRVPVRPLERIDIFTSLYALDIVLDGLRNPTKAQVEGAMAGHVLDQAELVGTYRKA